MDKENVEQKLKEKYSLLRPFLNEKIFRLSLAADAHSLGHGGISLVARAAGVSRTIIHHGIKELMESSVDSVASTFKGVIRKPGGGRKHLNEKDKTLEEDLEKLVSPYTRGNPESPLCWTSKSVEKLTNELNANGHKVSPRTTYRLLIALGYSLQSNKKSCGNVCYPDRDAQFEHISKTVLAFQAEAQPVISVDAKKKELIGNYKNAGHEWQPKEHPVEVAMHDFPDKVLGKVIPYGIYDLTRNEGWVSVGITHDTAEFAVESIRQWWLKMGSKSYPNASKLLITADSGGSNGYRIHLWKYELYKFANEFNLDLTICHFPPGTSKWNKIEHRMFSYITENWRGKPLISRAVVISLISHTTTKQGLKINAELDERIYELGVKPNHANIEHLNIKRNEFHGELNYSICYNMCNPK